MTCVAASGSSRESPGRWLSCSSSPPPYPRSRRPRRRGWPALAADDDGLAVTTKVTYRYDPAVPAVLVDTDLTITNEIPPVTRGNVIESQYFTGYGLGVPADAADLRAVTSDGRSLSVRKQAGESKVVAVAAIDFGRNLFHRDTVSLRFSYALPASTPRAESLSRVNAAFASFPIFTVGDAGRSAVELQVPSGYEVDIVGSPMDRSERGDVVVYSEPEADPGSFFADVIIRDDTALITEEVDLDPGTVRVRAWPGDQEWAEFVGEQVGDGVPVLEELIGLDWPRSDDTDVIESNTPYVYGYAGWFEPVNDVIEIGDELDQTVILHELTHRWFNDQMFSTRWINEGLAQELAAQAMAEMDGDPEASKLPPSSDPGYQPLNTWSDPQLQSAATEAQEAYGYAASYAVVHEVVDALGAKDTRRVLRAADADHIPYVGDATPERHVGAASWRYFLDLVEELGGAGEAAEQFEAVVVDDAGKDDLADRAEARERYADLEEAGRGWAAPLVVRRAMASWRFDEATQLIERSEAVLDRRAQLARRARALGVEEPRTLEARYEESERDLDVIDASLDGTQAALRALAAAEAAHDSSSGPLAAIGGWFSSADDELADARAAFVAGDSTEARAAAGRAREQAHAQTSRGAMALGGFVLVTSVVVVTVLLLLGRRRRPVPVAPTTAPADWGGPPST